MPMTRLTGWGRTAPSVANLVRPATADDAARAIAEAGPRGAIARGLGRSYGDAAQNGGGTVLDCTALDAIGPVDADGCIEVGGGASLDAIARAAFPHGWTLPVAPGTRFVTVGGAVASDVHGKNHHVDGSFARHVESIVLELPDGERRSVTRDSDGALFNATTGGMGLTGIILAARLRLMPVESRYMTVETRRTRDLRGTMDALETVDAAARYSVAWLDLVCGAQQVGRGIVSASDHTPFEALPGVLRAGARHYAPARRPVLPIDGPDGLLHRTAVRAFNEVRYRRTHDRRDAIVPIEAFWAPLDTLGAWNRLYGSHGLLQYQCVLPFGEERALDDTVRALASGPAPATLAVLKRFGEGTGAPLSFPIAGWTLAVDFPARALPALAPLLDRLDRRVAEAGGRVYLTKDARMRAEVVSLMYPRIDEWREVQARVDPGGRLTSDLDRRLRLTARSWR